jgi:hypothetical protein
MPPLHHPYCSHINGIEPRAYLEKAGPLTASLNVSDRGKFDLRIIGWETEGNTTQAVNLFRASWAVGKPARVTEYVPGAWEAELLATQG